MFKSKVKVQLEKEQEGFSLDQLWDFVEDLYNKSDTDPVARKLLETAEEKWEKSSQYAC